MYKTGKQIFSSYCRLGYPDPGMHARGLCTNCKSCQTRDASAEGMVLSGSENLFPVSFAKEQNLAGSVKSVKYLFSAVSYHFSHKLLTQIKLNLIMCGFTI